MSMLRVLVSTCLCVLISKKETSTIRVLEYTGVTFFVGPKLTRPCSLQGALMCAELHLFGRRTVSQQYEGYCLLDNIIICPAIDFSFNIDNRCHKTGHSQKEEVEPATQVPIEPIQKIQAINGDHKIQTSIL